MIRRLLAMEAIPFIIAGLLFAGTGQLNDSKISSGDCIEQLTIQTEEAVKIDFLLTLDGQRVFLEEFFVTCDQYGTPECVLFEKFYNWQSEVKTITSISRKGVVSHTIKVYYNPASICYPERVNPLRIYGDVAEFYDDCGEFMGIIVYIGEGIYFPLSFSGYSKKNWIFSFNGPKRM